MLPLHTSTESLDKELLDALSKNFRAGQNIAASAFSSLNLTLFRFAN
jgi:hypothetical protein